MNALPLPAPPPAGALYRARRWFMAGCLLAGSACVLATSLPAVVVWDFDNQTAVSALPPERIDFLKRALSESLTGTLLQVQGLPVVERQRLKDVLAEQKLGASALADEDARLRLGRIVGAQRMVFGGFFVLGETVQLHVRVVDTATSRVLFSDEASTPLADVMQQVGSMNLRLARALGGDARPLREHPAETWQAYDQALALADAGRLDEAVAALQALLSRAADFTPAERQLVALLDKLARR